MGDLIRGPFRDARLSATLAINERSAELARQGRDVFRLGFGQSPFPVPDGVVAALQQNAAEKDYLPVQGLGSLRQVVAEHHAREDGSAPSSEDVVIGPGSKELLFLLQLVLDADLLLPTPCWVSYAPQGWMLERRPKLLATGFAEGWKLDPAKLAEAARASTKPLLLVLNYPNNPTGQTYRPPELEALASVARDLGVLVFSDEIYGRLEYSGEHRSMSAVYPEATIVGSGLSKWCGAGGWRLGTFVFPRQLGDVRRAVMIAASETFTSVSAPVQYAAVEAFKGGKAIDDYLRHSRRVLAAVAGRTVQELTGAGIDVLQPQGGFYAFAGFDRFRPQLQSRGVRDCLEMTEAILEETGVALLPGGPFGREPSELWVRVAFVDFDGAGALAASRASGLDQALSPDFVDLYCPATAEGLRRLATWAREVQGSG